MKKYLFLLTCFGLLMASCRKDNTPQGPTVLEGKILEIDSDVPIANAQVLLVEVDATGSVFGPYKQTTLQQLETDASGNYKFSFQWNNKFSYNVAARASPDRYYSDWQIVTLDEGKNVQNVFIRPFAWLKIHIKNVSPVGAEDAINFNYGVFAGTSVDTSIIVKLAGSKKTTNFIGVKVRKNGIETSRVINIIAPPHDTTKLDIFY